MDVALFITCLVDQFFPRVGESTVALLEKTGARVRFPEAQTCCGQPVFNMGYRDDARELARRFVTIFEPFEEIVAPSGSCTSMVRVFYPELFHGETDWQERARRVGARTFELTEYLAARGFRTGARVPAKVTCLDSCHLLRELKVTKAPRELLSRVPGIELVEMEGADVCCGFGGAFSVKLPELSSSMLDAKLDAAAKTGAQYLASTDCGCLMHISGALHRRGSSLRAVHIAEILGGSI